MAKKSTGSPKIQPSATGLYCPQCRRAVGPYAIRCPACHADLLKNKPIWSNGMPRNDVLYDGTIFFNVAPYKLVVMSVFTMGWYLLYWAYRNWVYVDDHGDRRVWAAIRAFFHYFTYLILVRDVKNAAAIQRVDCHLSPFGLWVIYLSAPLMLFSGHAVMLSVLQVFPSLQFAYPHSFSVWLPYLIVFIGTMAILPTQICINRLNAQFSLPMDNRFTFANLLLVLIGVAWIGLRVHVVSQ
jgi:hypothetical protein